MKIALVLCLFLGVAVATKLRSGNFEYEYSISGRTLTGLHEFSNQYSGVLFQATLKIQPKSQEKWLCQLYNAKTAKVHSHLPAGWESLIPESELSWEPMPILPKSFEVVFKSGVITDLIVSKEVENWEANIIKGIMSQFQLDVAAKEFISSPMNVFPGDESRPAAVFKTMEETISGNTETLYEIHPIDESALDTGNIQFRNVFEVIKNKNYTNSKELPMFSFGFGDVNPRERGSNQMGRFFSRSSFTHAILAGDVDHHLLHNSKTVNRIEVSPTLIDQQKGMVVSAIQVSLKQESTPTQPIDEVSEPQRLRNLVYTYEARELELNLVREKRYESLRKLFPSSSVREWDKHLPEIKQTPVRPHLPASMAFKKCADIKETVEKLALEIDADLEDSARLCLTDSLDKFVILTSLIRNMNTEEISEVASALYTPSADKSRRAAWQIFRDAVSECGTGPALIAIQNWIISDKINGQEACQLVSAVARSARLPTLEYLKAYFELVRAPTVRSHWPLNDTALITFGDLLRRSVIENKKANEEEQEFVSETVIPYLTNELSEAIYRGQTHKIHAFIRAIGNIGHPKCLQAFEPYLEGKKQASQFQRLLMVAAMDKLVETHPKIAQSVLFKIYQNMGESQEIRAIAVYALTRTVPTPDMLQLMAVNTNIDQHQHVNAVVKSVIEQLSSLMVSKWEKLRQAAIAAKPFLTKQHFGIQLGRTHVLQYAYDNLNSMFKDSIELAGGEASFLPNVMKLTRRERLSGAGHRLLYLQAAVSSIDELVHITEEKTSSYQEKFREQQQRRSQQGENPWSSQNVARLLNMKADEMEQLEGNLYMEAGVPFGMFSFDNKTLGQLPELIREMEDDLREEKEFYYVKLSNNRERTISFPTEMGLPFLFSYDTPSIVKFEVSVKAISSPRVSQGGKLHTPKKIELQVNASVLVHNKIQGRLSFYTPYDRQQYISGYDKMSHVYIPMNGNVDVDATAKQVKAVIDANQAKSDTKLFGYFTSPYTSIVNIADFQSVATNPNTFVMGQQNLRRYDNIFGRKTTGIAFHVEIEHPRQFTDLSYVMDQMRSPNLPRMFWSLWNDGAIQRSNITFSINREQTATRKIIVGLGYDNKYTQDKQNERAMDFTHFSTAEDSTTRQKILREKVSAGIRNAVANTYDTYIQFQGEDKIEYVVTGALGKSNVDPKSRLVLYYKKTSDKHDIKPYELAFVSTSEIPNTNALDLEYSMQTEPKVHTRWSLQFGERKEKLSVLQGTLNLRRSSERKEYLKQQPMYLLCQREMREGNKQLQACANMTMESNLLDRVDAKIQYSNLEDDFKRNLRTIYDYLSLKYFLNIEQRVEPSEKSDEVTVRASFDNDLRSVNVSMRTKGTNTTITNIPLNEYAKRVFVQHPVFQMKDRLMSYMTGLQTFRPSCIVDTTRAATFNSRTYPIDLSNHWTVMFQYVPRDGHHGDRSMSVYEKLTFQLNNYVVLVRANPQNKHLKDMRLTLSTPHTEYKVVDIMMTPKHDSSEMKVEVIVDGQKVLVSEKEGYDVYGGYIEIYALPNGEVKLEVRGEFYLIYDGVRVRLSVIDDQFRNAVRGICGTFNDEPAEDYLTSQNCYVRESEKFWKSYEINSDEGHSTGIDFTRWWSNECAKKISPIYANVISDLDAGHQQSGDHSVKCSRFQTRYIEEDGHICFTTRALPVCHSTCRPRGVLKKNVDAHCIPKTNVAQLWKSQIDQGNSPDFSHKTVTKTITMDLPQTCTK